MPMLTMILKMSAITALFVLLTMLLWKRTERREMKLAGKLAIGAIYGIFAILSTHFGVDYSHMMLNVRDLGPLSAGLFFDPLSGVIAGLIGGIERYIAGRFWDVGSYTRIACSVSTCLAGFVAAAMHIWIFKRKKPSAIYAFFMGAVMEVFHMYVVFITHRKDMSMAFYVVRVCASPMIVFTGLGLGLSSTMLRVMVGEWKSPFRKISREEIPVAQNFQVWLFTVTSVVLLFSFFFSFAVQTQSALQAARDTLTAVSGDIRETYVRLKQTEDSISALAGETARIEAKAIAQAADHAGGIASADEAFLEQMCKTYNLVAATAVSETGDVIAAAGQSPVYDNLFREVLNGSVESLSVTPSSIRTVAGARCAGGMIQVVVDTDKLAQALNVSGLNEALSYFHVGSEGSFDIFTDGGIITYGVHRGVFLEANELAVLKDRPTEEPFTARSFGVQSLCRTERLDKGLMLLTQLPLTEIYANRDAQAYETAFADIILFAVIYVLISLLVQGIVVNNLQLVNTSLDRITSGHLDEVVNVYSSSEFASLSNDINQTVTVLKGYIDAAEKRIEQELEFARTIQDSALPKNFAFPRGDFEIFATMDPAKEVGGDFYDFFFVDRNKLALVIADVSGKGIPAALFMMRAKTAIRGLAESGQSPAEILRRANNALCEGNDAEMFVTVWLGIIDLTTGRMDCSNAGHEYPVMLRAGGDYDYIKDRHGLALAAMQDVRYREYALQFDPGDRLFVYTDGIPEAINETVEQYGPQRLLAVLNAEKAAPMQTLLPSVREDIAGFAGAAEQFDDITMLGFVYRGPAAKDAEKAPAEADA